MFAVARPRRRHWESMTDMVRPAPLTVSRTGVRTQYLSMRCVDVDRLAAVVEHSHCYRGHEMGWDLSFRS